MNQHLINLPEILQSRTNKLAVAIFSLPGNPEVHILTQNLSEVRPKVTHAPTFFIHPFESGTGSPSLMISPDKYYLIPHFSEVRKHEKDNPGNDKISAAFWVHSQVPDPTKKEDYIRSLTGLKHRFSNQNLEKLMLSRAKTIHRGNCVPSFALLEKLKSQYPHSFLFLFSSPYSGTWMGASPEILIERKGMDCRTVSLAGTRKTNESSNWTAKEFHEQGLVTRQISDDLERLNAEDIQTDGPGDHLIGDLLHLRTEFSFRLSPSKEPGSALQQIINALHPTAAVGSYPREPVFELVRSHEGFSRQYYTGYAGPIWPNGDIALLVILRCIQFFPNQLAFYAGAGITADSDPEAEWEETENKISLLDRVVADFV
jgi:isochorismate synthase